MFKYIYLLKLLEIMRVLFVCKHNRFRSKVAEAIFSKIDIEGNEAKSVGIGIDNLRPYVSRNVISILKDEGYKIEDEMSRKIDDRLIEWADKIIVVADNVFLDSDKVEKWEVEDCDEGDLECIRRVFLEIERKVWDLVKRINV